MLILQENEFFSLSTPRFFIFYETALEGGVLVKRTGTNKGGRGSKTGSFERT